MTKVKKPAKKLHRVPVVDQFFVIQPSLSRGMRTSFESEEDAREEARALLSGRKHYGVYIPPKKLLVVKLVGAEEARVVVRKSPVEAWDKIGEEDS